MSNPAVSAPPGLARGALPVAVAAIAAVTVVVGLAIRARTRIDLGTPLPPFLFSWSPLLRWPAVIAAAVPAACALAAPWLMQRIRGRALFATAVYGQALAIGLAVNAARRGTAGWSHVFDLSGRGSFEASREYLPALASLRHGVASYVGHFAQLLPYLPTHVKGNPPGPVVAMHLLGLTTASRLTAACIVLGALCAPLAYALGETLGDERRGRRAGTLTAFSPAVVLFGVTSVDYVFAALGTATAWLLVSPRARTWAAGCALAALGSFASWLLLAIPVWAVLVVAQRRGPRAALVLAAALAAAVLAFTLALAAAVGYDPVAVLCALSRAYGAGAAAHRPYVFWLLGSPVAWLVILGPPITWLAVRSLADRDPAAVALAVLVVLSAVAGVTKAETERIWLPFVPLACVAAAAAGPRRLRWVLAALATQAVAVEILFGTVW